MMAREEVFRNPLHGLENEPLNGNEELPLSEPPRRDLANDGFVDVYTNGCSSSGKIANDERFHHIEEINTVISSDNAIMIDIPDAFSERDQSQPQECGDGGGKGSCPECRAGPMVLRSLYAHVRKNHNWCEDSVTRLKSSYKRRKSNAENEFPCQNCEVIFFTEYGLRRHVKKVHNFDLNNNDRDPLCVVCPVCEGKFSKYCELAVHCSERHGTDMPDQNFSIVSGRKENWVTFEDWKHAMEESTTTHLVIRDSYESSTGRSITYVCQHARGAGNEVNILALRQRYRTPRRIYSHCSAFLKVVYGIDGTVSYTGCFGHIGHSLTTATLPLPSEDEEKIVEMLKSGLSPSVILTNIRSTRWDPLLDYGMQARICYTSLKDIKYIAQKRGLVEGRFHKNDLISLEELLKISPDIADHTYKKSADPTGDGFVLALLTRSGKKFLERFGGNGVVFDDTFDVTRYAFRLATLLVSNDGGKGFPCCFLVSYRMTSEEIALLFELIKRSIPNFETRYLMTDDTNVFYKGYITIFPHSRAQKILCSFHVLKCVQKKLHETLTAQDEKLGQQLFRELFHQATIRCFEQKYAAFLSWLHSINAEDTVQYMERCFSGRRTEWAPCYRRLAPFATSNHAEAWHNTLKHVILLDKQNSRLDNLVFSLIRHTTDLEMKLLSQAVRSSSDGKGRRTQTLKRHRDAVTKYAERQERNSAWLALRSILGLIIPLRPNTWGVASKSKDEVLYTVYIGQLCSCDSTDNSHCERCGVCYFQLSCDCPDALKAGVACIHCHAVAIYAPGARELLPRVQHPLSMPARESSQTSFVSDDASDEVAGSSISQEIPLDILEHDEVNAEYQRLKGAESYMDELARQCLQRGLTDALRKLRIAVEREVHCLSSETGIHCDGPVRRSAVQKQGVTPKPGLILSYKTRKQVIASKKKGNIREDENPDVQKVWDMPRDSLIICFVCGRRQPPDSEDQIRWYGCDNSECRAWAHTQCTQGRHRICTICKVGVWQLDCGENC